MKRILLHICIITLLFSCNNKSYTELYILGSVHKPLPLINTDSVYKYIKNINPEIILLEADSSLYTILDTINLKKTDKNELKAVARYIKAYPETELKPIDYEGKQAYYKKHNIFKNKRTLNNVLDSLTTHNLLPSKTQIILDSLKFYNKQWTSFRNNQTLSGLNSDTSYKLIRKVQYYNYQKVIELINLTKELKPYLPAFKKDKNFWQRRNQAITKNALQYLKEKDYSRAIIITGIFHKPYVQDLLEKKKLTQEDARIKIKNIDYLIR